MVLHELVFPSATQSNYSPVPVSLGVFVEWRKHDWQDYLDIVAHEVAKVLVVPKVERPLCYLEMGTGDRLGELMKQRLLNLCEFRRIHDLKDVFDFVQKHDLFGAVDLGPVSEKSQNNLRRLACKV